MAKELKPEKASFTRASQFDEGDVAGGYFVGAVDVGADNDGKPRTKIEFDVDGRANLIARWVTAGLRRFISQMNVGEFYVIECLGKKPFGDGTRKAWAYKVWHLDKGEEQAGFLAKYGAGLIREAAQNRPEKKAETDKVTAPDPLPF